jgi:hypothetical protein
LGQDLGDARCGFVDIGGEGASFLGEATEVLNEGGFADAARAGDVNDEFALAVVGGAVEVGGEFGDGLVAADDFFLLTLAED